MSKPKTKVESGLDKIFASIKLNSDKVNQVNNKKKLDENADKLTELKKTDSDKMTEYKMTDSDKKTYVNMTEGKNDISQNDSLCQFSHGEMTEYVKMTEFKSKNTLIVYNYFSVDIRKYIYNIKDLNYGARFILLNLLDNGFHKRVMSQNKFCKTLGIQYKTLIRHIDELLEKLYIEKEVSRNKTYISLAPLFTIYLREKGCSEISPDLFFEFLENPDSLTSGKLTEYLPSKYVSSFIYKEKTEDIQTEKKFEISNKKVEEFRRIIFWLYWFGIDYKDARVNNIRVLLELLETEPDADNIFMSICYTGEKSANTKIDNKWAYFLRGVGKYGSDGVKLKEFGEIKAQLEKLYELAKMNETQRENFLIENNNLIQFVREKTRKEIPEKPKKSAELKVLESQIMTAYNSIDKFMEINKVSVELNAFEKSRLNRKKDPRAGGSY